MKATCTQLRRYGIQKLVGDHRQSEGTQSARCQGFGAAMDVCGRPTRSLQRSFSRLSKLRASGWGGQRWLQKSIKNAPLEPLSKTDVLRRRCGPPRSGHVFTARMRTTARLASAAAILRPAPGNLSTRLTTYEYFKSAFHNGAYATSICRRNIEMNPSAR